MEFTNEFRVSLPVEPAWELFNDVERLVPCMPGARLTDVEGDRFLGTVKVKVGPVTVQYRGTASFEERDLPNRTVVVKASGRETRGQGNADAGITVRLAADGDGTRVTVATRLSVTGKVAQFGRSAMEDISKKLLAQFVASLEEQLAAERDVPAGPAVAQSAVAAEPAAAPAAPKAPPPPRLVTDEPLDLLNLARGAVLKRLVPAVAGALAIVALAVWLNAHRGHRS